MGFVTDDVLCGDGRSDNAMSLESEFCCPKPTHLEANLWMLLTPYAVAPFSQLSVK